MLNISFIIKKLILLFFFAPLAVLVKLVKKIFKFEAYYLTSYRIGNLAVGPEILCKTKNSKKRTYLIFEKPISNIFLYTLYKKKLKDFNIICLKDNIFIKAINKANLLFSKNEIIKRYKIDRSKFYIFDNKQKFLNLQKKDINYGYESIKKINLQKKDKWICIHNRDSEYLKSIDKSKNWSYHNYRDYSINSMVPSIKYFISKGYKIVRIGKNSNEKILYRHASIIDLPFNKIRTDFIEIFLVANCEFFIGTSSGAFKLARIFRKPVFLINVCPFESLFVEKWNYPAIFKRLFHTKLRNYVKISNIIKQKLAFINDTRVLRKKKLEFRSNTPSEILNFSKEILEFLKNEFFFYNNKLYGNKLYKFQNIIKKDYKISRMKFKNHIGKTFLLSIKL